MYKHVDVRMFAVKLLSRVMQRRTEQLLYYQSLSKQGTFTSQYQRQTGSQFTTFKCGQKLHMWAAAITNTYTHFVFSSLSGPM